MSVTTKVSSKKRNRHLVIEVSSEFEGEVNFYVFRIIGKNKYPIVELKGSKEPPSEVYEHLWLEGFFTI